MTWASGSVANHSAAPYELSCHLCQNPVMATIVVLHAHPDDEAIATSGTMAKAKADGHRVVLVVATRGELGQSPDDLAEGESLADRRTTETLKSAAIIGADRVAFLGYRDSGMEDDPRINDLETFHSADLESASQRMADILREEGADILIGYDERGNYLHPDHIKVHLVGARAAEIAGTPKVFEATMNRDFLWKLMQQRTQGLPPEMQAEVMGNATSVDDFNLGMREWTITHRVDVAAYVPIKKAAMIAHASQINDQSFFLQMPEEMFAESFGQEWFIHRGVSRGTDEPFADSLL